MLSHQLSGSSKFVSPVQTSERANNNAKIFGMTKPKFMEAIKPTELASRSMTYLSLVLGGGAIAGLAIHGTRSQTAICPFRKNDLRGGGGHSWNWPEHVSAAVYPKHNRTAYVDRELAYKERFQSFRDLCKARGVSCQSGVYV
jgi:hypothetical protein